MHKTYLGHDHEFPRLGVDGLDQSAHGDVADLDPLDVAHAADGGHVLVGNGEEDVGLRLRAALRRDLSTAEKGSEDNSEFRSVATVVLANNRSKTYNPFL